MAPTRLQTVGYKEEHVHWQNNKTRVSFICSLELLAGLFSKYCLFHQQFTVIMASIDLSGFELEGFNYVCKLINQNVQGVPPEAKERLNRVRP